METERSLTVIKESLPAEVLPKFESLLKRMSPNKRGFEGGARWLPAVLRVNQPTSGKAPPKAVPGDLYTDTGKVVARPFKFVPIYAYDARIQFNVEDNTVKCSSEDGNTNSRGLACPSCPNYHFIRDKKDQCNKTINVYMIDEMLEEIYLFSFMKKWGYATGAKLLRQALATNEMWDQVYSLTTVLQQKAQSKYYMTEVNFESESPDYVRKVAGELCDMITAVRVKVLETVKEGVQNASAPTGERPMVSDVDAPVGSTTTPGDEIRI